MSLKYLHHFFSLKCSRDLLPFFQGCKSRAAKEITESFACYSAAVGRWGDLNDWAIVVVGDGKRPRTGSVFRLMTKAFHVWSIDPIADMQFWKQDLPELYGLKIRDMTFAQARAGELHIPCLGKRTLIVLPHSHCSMDEAIRCLEMPGQVSVISLPCCKPTPLPFLTERFTDRTGFRSFVDLDVMSPHRTIQMWDDWFAVDPKRVQPTDVLTQPMTKPSPALAVQAWPEACDVVE